MLPRKRSCQLERCGDPRQLTSAFTALRSNAEDARSQDIPPQTAGENEPICYGWAFSDLKKESSDSVNDVCGDRTKTTSLNCIVIHEFTQCPNCHF